MSHLWIVSGRRGAGKTTFCQGVVENWCAAGGDAAGILSPAVFSGTQKIGIDAVDLRSGERRRLADLRTAEDDPCDPLFTRRWRFDPAVTAWGGQVLAQAAPCGLLVVDELGPLEFERGQGWLSGLAALDGGRYELALAVIRPELLEMARARWPWAKVRYLQR